MEYAGRPFDPGEPDGSNPTLNSPISSDGTPTIGTLYRIPPREGRAVRVRSGELLSIVNTHGTQVCDFWAFNANDIGEFVSMPHLHGVRSGIYPRAGDSLVSNCRRPLMTFVSDTSPGVHDTVVAACDIYRYRHLGVHGYHDNCTDNLRMALLAIGLRAREIPAPFNVWMNTPVIEGGAIEWLPPVSKRGDRVSFRAEHDVIAVMSACPQDMVPINGTDNTPQDLEFMVSLEEYAQ
jgi:uncharacterized protein YcgI (DUF1989 family)